MKKKINPDFYRIDKLLPQYIYPKMIDPKIVPRAEIIEMSNGEFYVDLIVHVNHLHRERLATTSRTTDIRTRIFKSSSYALSFLRKRGVEQFGIFIGSCAINRIKEIEIGCVNNND